MGSRKPHGEKVYGTYQPYPISRDADLAQYDADAPAAEPNRAADRADEQASEDVLDLLADAGPTDWSLPDPIQPDPTSRPKTLSILQSLFADRLDLLRATLRELETAEQDRERLTRAALEEIDSRIAYCEEWLRLFRGDRALNDLQRRKHLERQLLELKRQRRHEALLSWRDLLSLRREIRTLQREVASVARTLPPGENRDAPR